MGAKFPHRVTIEDAPTVTALILNLFILSRPFNVAGLVVPVIVDTVQAVNRRRAWAKCSDEFFNAGESEFDAAPAVPFVV